MRLHSGRADRALQGASDFIDAHLFLGEPFELVNIGCRLGTSDPLSFLSFLSHAHSELLERFYQFSRGLQPQKNYAADDQ